MIFDNLENFKNKKFFAIIIGSGPAGISVALKLEEKGFDTLIIEAGSQNYSNESLNFLDGEVFGDNYSDLKTSRLRQFGGSSGHWGGTCSILKDSDFNDWPIKKNDIDYYQKDAKKILNIKNNFYFNKFSDNLEFFNMQWSDVRFKDKYFEYIKKSKKIHLSLNTNFCYFEGSNGLIEKIVCKKKGYHKLISKFYILSCGGIENSRSLLISKKKNPELFKFDLPIGKYYMDHPKHDIGEGILDYNKFKNFLSQKKRDHFLPIVCENIQLSLDKDKIKKRNILNSAVEINLERATPTSEIIHQASCVAPKFIQKIYNSINSQDIYKVNLSMLQEQFPTRENLIKLSSKLDPNNLELPEVHWKKTTRLRDSATFIINEVSDIFIKEDIGRLSINEDILIDKDYPLTLGNHQLGGTRMGENISDSVVDKDLLVFGFRNLYVNGSSVFRTGGYAHPTFTIVQLASRLGEHLSNA